MSTTPSDSSPIEPPLKRLSDLSPLQRRSGLAAWLGWLFDGLDSYLYIIVAGPFVMELMGKGASPDAVKRTSAYIQAAFLIGWALGGVIFGRIGDRFGRSRTISWTILTYAICTGLSSLAQNWEGLMLFRFLAALGIGGEWAAGSSLVAETWPRHWRPWVSAALQTAYQFGLLLATFASAFFVQSPRWVFLVGAAPALIVFWIRRNVPETEEWHRAKTATAYAPTIRDLFGPKVIKTTILTILLCSAALTTTWALVFFFPQQLRQLPDVKAMSKEAQGQYITQATLLVNIIAIGGNFFAALLARRFGYRWAIGLMFLGSLVSMLVTYGVPRDHITILYYAPFAHFFVQGVFGLFPLYVPPLFPTLLRTTGAGFCYNIGRVAAAVGTLVFGVYAPVKDMALALVVIGLLYLPALLIAALIPEPTTDPAAR